MMGEMIDLRWAFLMIPDLIIITDLYYYIIDFNRVGVWDNLKKGKSIRKYLEFDNTKDEFEIDGKIYGLKITPVINGGQPTGYIFYFTNITGKRRILEEIKTKGEELESANKTIAQANAELSEYAKRAEEIADDTERVQVARHIHDNVGHTMTVLHTISQMCRILLKKSGVDAEYLSLRDEGVKLCDQGITEQRHYSVKRAYSSLGEAISDFSKTALFPVRLQISGTEPEAGQEVIEVILKICKEAYHNTLSHTMADHLSIDLAYEDGVIKLRIKDNGKCTGTFSKGYGLTRMEDAAHGSGADISFAHRPGQGFEINFDWRRQEAAL